MKKFTENIIIPFLNVKLNINFIYELQILLQHPSFSRIFLDPNDEDYVWERSESQPSLYYVNRRILDTFYNDINQFKNLDHLSTLIMFYQIFNERTIMTNITQL